MQTLAPKRQIGSRKLVSTSPINHVASSLSTGRVYWATRDSVQMLANPQLVSGPNTIVAQSNISLICVVESGLVVFTPQGDVLLIDDANGIRYRYRLGDGFVPRSASSSADGKYFGVVAEAPLDDDSGLSMVVVWNASNPRPIFVKQVLGVRGISLCSDIAVLFGEDNPELIGVDLSQGNVFDFLSRARVKAFAFSPNAELIVFASLPGVIEIHSAKSGSAGRVTLHVPNELDVKAVSFNIDNDALIVQGLSSALVFVRRFANEWDLVALPAGIVDAVFVDSRTLFFATYCRVGFFNIEDRSELGEMNFGVIAKIGVLTYPEALVLQRGGSLLNVHLESSEITVLAPNCRTMCLDRSRSRTTFCQESLITTLGADGSKFSGRLPNGVGRIVECTPFGESLIVSCSDRTNSEQLVGIERSTGRISWTLRGYSCLAPESQSHLVVSESSESVRGGSQWEVVCYSFPERMVQWRTRVKEQITSMEMVDGQQRVALGLGDGSLICIEIDTGNIEVLGNFAKEPILALLNLDDESLLVCQEYEMLEFQFRQKKIERSFIGPVGVIYSCDRIERQVFAGGEDGCIYMWEL